MKILVTGGAGFIGSHFAEYVLSRPEVEKVIVLDALTYAGNRDHLRYVASNNNFEFHLDDIRNTPRVEHIMATGQITHVAHFAAESHVDRSIVGPNAFVTTNVDGTFNLLEAARRYLPPEGRFLQVSTDEVYGSVADDYFSTEEAPCRPSSPYSASKAAADMLVNSYHVTYKLPTLITRSSNNYGPRQHNEKLIPTVINSILTGKPIPLYGDGLHVRDWIHVKDNCRAIWRVLKDGQPGEIYNVGADNPYDNLSLVNLIRETMQSHTHRGTSPITFVEDRPGHDRRYAVSVKKLQSLAWFPAISFSDGLDQTVRWYLENKIPPAVSTCRTCRPRR